MIFECLSPCKINEFLYITGKRPDGYHNLETLFVVLNFGDRMHFEISEEGQVQLATAFDFPQEQNLIYKAAMLLKENYYVKKGCRISIDKVLPQGGGLGGGSGNAATVLQVLSTLWDLNLDDETLIELGITLGADVPLFIKGVPTFGQARGEILTPVDYPKHFYLVVNPGCKVPTATLFKSPLLKRNSTPLSFAEHMQKSFENCFTPVVTATYPQVKDMLLELSAYGNARMSGSGSSCFVSFTNKDECDRACAQMRQKHPNLMIFSACSCSKNIVREALARSQLS